jgi:hypothetical protein
MEMTRRTWIGVLVGAAAVAGSLAYLRDPPWLLGLSSGMRGWQIGTDGARYRWAAGHSSFFVPSDAGSIEIPLRATFDAPHDWPIVATITLDDRPVDRLVLSDAAWRRAVIILPSRHSRRVLRIDIRLDRTRDENHGVAVGEIRVR